VPRSIESIARSLLRIAKHNVIELAGIDSRPLDRSLRRHRAQFLRRIIFDLPAIASKGRTYPADDRNVSRF